jgi:hypothetical protein
MITTGIVSLILLLSGSFRLFMHLAGAGPLLVFGMGTLSILFLPMMLILKAKESNMRDKLISGLGVLVGFLLCLSILATLMHWPGGDGLLWYVTLGVLTFLIIPIYFFTGIRNPDKQLNTIMTSMMLVGATALLFIAIDMRPSQKQLEIKMYTYIQNEALLKKIQQTGNGTNELCNDINFTSEQIKGLIIESTMGEATIPKDFEEQHILADDDKLGPDFYKADGKGAILLSHLKEVVNKYNVATENKIPVDHFQMDKMNSYNNFTILNYLVQLQMYLATNENKMTACK